MGIFWVIVLIGIGFGIYVLMNRSKSPSPHNETSLDILQKRYAKGEISKEAYEQMKNDVTN